MPPRRRYGAYRNCLRLEFKYTCAYCLAREVEVGPVSPHGNFEIEHFKPKGRREFRRFEDVYENLLWVCNLCNRAKGDKWPSDDEARLGFRFVDPSKEALADHLALDGATVEARTPAGQFMLEEIRLGSKAHEHRRDVRAALAQSIAVAEAELSAIRARVSSPETVGRIDEVSRRLAEIAGIVRPGAPWDPPSECVCKSV